MLARAALVALVLGLAANIAAAWGSMAFGERPYGPERTTTGVWPIRVPADWPPPNQEWMLSNRHAEAEVYLRLEPDPTVSEILITHQVWLIRSGFPLPALELHRIDHEPLRWAAGSRISTWASRELGWPGGVPLRPLWTGTLLNTALYSACVFPFVAAPGIIRSRIRHRRRNAGRCERCAYDLTGAHDGCPECGAGAAD